MKRFKHKLLSVLFFLASTCSALSQSQGVNGVIVGGSGSVNDYVIVNDLGTIVCSLATGTTTVNCNTLTLTNPLGSNYGGAGTVNGALKGNGSGVVSHAACADLSNGVASCSTDTTNASNITSGSLPVGQAGASPASHGALIDVGGTSTWKVVPNCTDVTGNHLNYTQSTDAWSCGTSLPTNTVTSKAITFTYDLTTTNATTTTTHLVGFQPTSCTVMSSVGGGNAMWSSGTVDSALNQNEINSFSDSSNAAPKTGAIIWYTNAAGTAAQVLTITAYVSDGFSFSNAKTGSPSGTLTIEALCTK